VPDVNRGAALAAAALLMTQASWSATAGDCAWHGPVSVRVTPVHGSIAEDALLSLADIQAKAGPERAAAHFPLLGMSTSILVYAAALAMDTDVKAEDEACAVLTGVDVHIGYLRRIVHVATEASADACLHGVVLSHQHRHMRADDDAVERFAPFLSHQLRRFMDELQPAVANTVESATASLNAAVDAYLDDQLASYRELNRALQDLVDSPSELRGLAEACSGRGKELVDRPGMVPWSRPEP
jgi:hypothetical protein